MTTALYRQTAGRTLVLRGNPTPSLELQPTAPVIPASIACKHIAEERIIQLGKYFSLSMLLFVLLQFAVLICPALSSEIAC
jgi:hypothetical protein